MEDLVPAPLAIKTQIHSSSVTKRETLRKHINPRRILALARRKKPPAVSPSEIKAPSPAMNVTPVAPRENHVLVNEPARDGPRSVIELISDSDDDGNVIDLAGVPSSPPRAPVQLPGYIDFIDLEGVPPSLPRAQAPPSVPAPQQLPQQQQPLPQHPPPNGQPNGASPGLNHAADINHMNPTPLLNGNAEHGWQQFGDFVHDDEFTEEMIARLFGNQPNDQNGFEPEAAQPFQFEPLLPAPQPPAAPQPLFAQPNLPAQQFQQGDAEPHLESRSDCIETVLALFPGVCRDHVGELYDRVVGKSSDLIIAHILDKTEKGTPYPKAKKSQDRTLKRKRELTEEEAAVQKYGAADRPSPVTQRVMKYIRSFLSFEFRSTSMSFIDSTLSLNRHRLFHAYRVLEQAEREWNPSNPTYVKLKTSRKMNAEYNEQNLQAVITTHSESPEIREVILEIQAARKVRAKADEDRAAEHLRQLAEEANERQAQLDGTMSECGCCFEDYPMNRMIHCDSDTLHWFCRGCAKQMADTEIGASKYVLRCMSMDGCESGFSNDQRLLFLDEPTRIALERTEQEANLRMAGIENLASCPFCPYAAEYPPVEINKEFKCQAPDCEKVSCRLCKLESHIPKSCEEFAKENGLSIRRQIEEAMSAALIRKCNKCSAPFIKEEGCNKMTCTKCGNLQCYICSASCTYAHFNDTSRGGKAGNCPLFDEKHNIEQRHEEEVSKAEKEALAKVRAEHPEYTEEDLKVKLSKDAIEAEEARKSRNPHYRNQQMMAQVAAARPRVHGQGQGDQMLDIWQNMYDMNQLIQPREHAAQVDAAFFGRPPELQPPLYNDNPPPDAVPAFAPFFGHPGQLYGEGRGHVNVPFIAAPPRIPQRFAQPVDGPHMPPVIAYRPPMDADQPEALQRRHSESVIRKSNFKQSHDRSRPGQISDKLLNGRRADGGTRGRHDGFAGRLPSTKSPRARNLVGPDLLLPRPLLPGRLENGDGVFGGDPSPFLFPLLPAHLNGDGDARSRVASPYLPPLNGLTPEEARFAARERREDDARLVAALRPPPRNPNANVVPRLEEQADVLPRRHSVMGGGGLGERQENGNVLSPMHFVRSKAKRAEDERKAREREVEVQRNIKGIKKRVLGYGGNLGGDKDDGNGGEGRPGGDGGMG